MWGIEGIGGMRGRGRGGHGGVFNTPLFISLEVEYWVLGRGNS